MNVMQKIKDVFYTAIKSNNSPQKLAVSFCIGIFIAFSPFPGAHTVLMFAAQWLLRLNFPILFIATSFNNPWTMVPFFAFDYSFGYWLIHYFLGWHPSWFISLEQLFGSGKICIISFLIGGNVLGLGAALLSYPFMVLFFKKIAAKIANSNQSVV